MSASRDQDLKSFHSLLLKLNGGGLNDMLTEAMNKAIQEISDACCDRGGKHKSRITLHLDFIMDQKDKIVEIAADVVEKHPKAPVGRVGLFWVDSNGNLIRENPRQLTIEDELERKRMMDIQRAGHTN